MKSRTELVWRVSTIAGAELTVVERRVAKMTEASAVKETILCGYAISLSRINLGGKKVVEDLKEICR